jgi:hypothetical protein
LVLGSNPAPDAFNIVSDEPPQRHTRFMKSFSYHLPFGTKDAYVKEIMTADLNKIANLIRICGFLMQTKAYLFWHVI